MLKNKIHIPPMQNMRYATEDDFRIDGHLKLGVEYYKYCFWFREWYQCFTNEDTNRNDLKIAIEFNWICVHPIPIQWNQKTVTILPQAS